MACQPAWAALGGTELEPQLHDDPELGGEPIRLVDARYLIRFAKQPGARMIRRQDCESSAFLPLDLLRSLSLGTGNALRVIAVSHAWMQPDYPDPRGDNLGLLGKVLELYVGESETYGVMIDFMSAPQKGAAGEERNPTEAALFRRALHGMGDWYSHPETIVLKLTRLPVDYPAAFSFPVGLTPNTAGYHDRGWCFEEASVAALAKSSSKVLDLSLYDGTAQTLHELKSQCKANRPPLLTPAAFETALESKRFTSRKADVAHVRQLYSSAFERRLGSAKELWFRELGWGNEEVAALVAVVATGVLARLELLVLDSNCIGDSGAAALAETIRSGKLPRLRTLGIVDNPLSVEAMKDLKAACGSGQPRIEC